MTSQVRRRQGCPMPINRDVLNLVIVNNVGFRSRIREGIDVLFTRRAVTSDNTFHVNNFKLTVLRFTPQDIEACVVQLRFGNPLNIDMPCVLVAHGTELRQGNKAADHPDGSRVCLRHRDVRRKQYLHR